MLRKIVDEIKWGSLGRGLLAVAPTTVAALVTGDARWFKAGLVAMSSFIASERVNLLPLGVLLHGLAILLGYAVMTWSLADPLLFVICCALFGGLTVAVMSWGSNLRLVGSFTFIPALYLTCEAAEGGSADLLSYPPMMAAALLPVIALATVDWLRTRPRASFLDLSRVSPGALPPNLAEMVLSVSLGVGVAAATVRWQGLENGQWAIWSAASVVTGNLASSEEKMSTRAFGAVVGVPLGVAVGFLLPHAPLAYGLATLGTLLTLDIFRTYRVQFTATCAMVALALQLAGQTPGIAAERTINVVLGGFLGVLALLLVHAVRRLTGR